MNKSEVTPVQIAIRIVVIIIVLVILLLVSFAMVRFVPKVLSSLANLRTLFTAKERIAVSLDKISIREGSEAILTFKQTGGKTVGHYELSFSCSKVSSGTSLEIEGNEGSDTLSCDDEFTLPVTPSSTATYTATIIPKGEEVSYDQPMLITIKHISASSTVASASTTLTILGKEEVVEEEKPIAATSTPIVLPPLKPVTTYNPPVYHAPAHLVATLSGVTVDRDDRAVLTFYVTNKGGQASGSWSFSAHLPRSTGQTVYNSPSQSSIPAGGTSTMYLTFYNAEAGTINVYVENSSFSATLK